jgi:hypothetical protein
LVEPKNVAERVELESGSQMYLVPLTGGIDSEIGRGGFAEAYRPNFV